MKAIEIRNKYYSNSDTNALFLSQWKSIKEKIILANAKQKEVYNNNFVA